MKQTKFLFVLAFLCLQTWQSAFAETFEVNGIVIIQHLQLLLKWEKRPEGIMVI